MNDKIRVATFTGPRRGALTRRIVQFRDAFTNLNAALEDHGWKDWQADIAEDYPFNTSFDDLVVEVAVWTDTLSELIETKLGSAGLKDRLEAAKNSPTHERMYDQLENILSEFDFSKGNDDVDS